MKKLKCMIDGLKVTGHVRPVWVCRRCGSEGIGDPVSVERTWEPVMTFELPSASFRHAIPVGWSSDGTEGVTCPKCIKAREQELAKEREGG